MTPHDEYDSLIGQLETALQRRIERELEWREGDEDYESARAHIQGNRPATNQQERALARIAVEMDMECTSLAQLRRDAWQEWQEAEREVEILRDRISALRLRLQGRMA